MLAALAIATLLLTQTGRLKDDPPEPKPKAEPKPIVYPLSDLKVGSLPSVFVRDKGAEPRFNLQYRATIGDRVACDFTARATAGARERLTSFRVHMEAVVTDVAADRITLKAFFTGWTLLNSGELDKSIAQRVQARKKAFEGAGCRFMVSPEGVVSYFELIDVKGEHINSEDADLFLNALREVIPPLPTVPLGKGAVWEVRPRAALITFGYSWRPLAWLMRLDAVDAKEARAACFMDDPFLLQVYPEADPDSEARTKLKSLELAGGLVLRTGLPLPVESTLKHSLKHEAPGAAGKKPVQSMTGAELSLQSVPPKPPAPAPATPPK